MRHLGIVSLIACLAVASGCNLCCWGKRNAELTGPTDIRKSQLWCLGEDALFHQPMGPSREDYGLKQTCWREWPADGAPCANGSCGPAIVPGGSVPHSAPYSHPEPTPGIDPNPQANPFRDDALPTPAGAANRRSAQPRAGSAVTQSSEFQSLFGPPGVGTKRPPTRGPRQSPTTGPSLPPRAITVAAPRNLPALLPKSASVAPKQANRMRISVSDAIDTPHRTLAPIRTPGAAVSSPTVSSTAPSETKATLASLERMIDVAPTTTERDHVGPAVIRNEFAASPGPFQLSTRSTLGKKSADPALAEKSLSALGAMMADETSTDEN